jgi:hypothetical protein
MKQQMIAEMKKIAKVITTQQKRQLMADLNLSQPTLEKYLKGEIVKIDIVESIINQTKKTCN